MLLSLDHIKLNMSLCSILGNLIFSAFCMPKCILNETKYYERLTI